MSVPSKILAICVTLLMTGAAADKVDYARQLLQAVQDQNRTQFVITRDAAVRFAGLNLTRPGAELNSRAFSISSPDDGKDSLLDFGNQVNVLAVSAGSSLVFQRVSLQGILPNTADPSTSDVPIRNTGLNVWPAITVVPGGVVGFDQANVVFAARWCGPEQLQELLTMMRSRYGSNDIHIVDGTVLYIATNLSMNLPVVQRSSNTTLGYMHLWTSQTRLVCFPDPSYMAGGAALTPAPSLDIVQSVIATEQPAPTTSDSGLPVAVIICLAVAIPAVAMALVAALTTLLLRRRRDVRRGFNSNTSTPSSKAAGPQSEHAMEGSSTGCNLGESGGATSGATSRQRNARAQLESFQDRSWQLRYEAPTDLTIVKQIGQGSFGKVYKAYWQGRPVAVKVVANAVKTTSAGCELRRIQQGDLQIATAVNHPNLVATYRIWLDAHCHGAACHLHHAPGLSLRNRQGPTASLADKSLPLPQAVASHAELQQRLRGPATGMPAPCVSNSHDDDSTHGTAKVPLRCADIVRTTSSTICCCASSNSAEEGVHTANAPASCSAVQQCADRAGFELAALKVDHSGRGADGVGLNGRATCSVVATHQLPDPAPVSALEQPSAYEGTGHANAAVHPGNPFTEITPVADHTSKSIATSTNAGERLAHSCDIGHQGLLRTSDLNVPDPVNGQQCCAPSCYCNRRFPSGAVLANAQSSGDRTPSEVDTATSTARSAQPSHATEKLEQFHLLCMAHQRSIAYGAATHRCDTSHDPHNRQDGSFCQWSRSGQRHAVGLPARSTVECTTDAALLCACCCQGVQGEEGDVDRVPRSRGEEMSSVETYIMMEYCEFGNLRDAVASGKLKRDGGQQDWEKVLLCLRDVAAGIAALHEHNVIHGDIKSANVLLKASRQREDKRGFVCKVADLGLSRWFGTDGQMTHTITQTMGTVAYQPPEMLQGGKLAKAVDVYSLGVLAWELACERPPFSSHHPGQVFYHVIVLKQREEIPEEVNPELAQLIRDCWHPDPSARPTAAIALSRVVRLLQQCQAAGGKRITPCDAP